MVDRRIGPRVQAGIELRPGAMYCSWSKTVDLARIERVPSMPSRNRHNLQVLFRPTRAVRSHDVEPTVVLLDDPASLRTTEGASSQTHNSDGRALKEGGSAISFLPNGASSQ